MELLPHTRGCFVCGLHNPIGFRLDITSDTRIVESRFSFKQEHAGFRGVIHGGLISTVLDEMMAWVIGVNARRFAYAAELNIRFFQPASPETPLLARGELIENKKGRLFLARAKLLTTSEELLAEGNGKFLPVPLSQNSALFRDFAEDPTRWFGAEAAAWAEGGAQVKSPMIPILGP